MTNRTALDAYMDVAIARNEGRGSVTLDFASLSDCKAFIRMLRRNNFTYEKINRYKIKIIINNHEKSINTSS
jgi:hypothetical protein